MIIPFSLQFSLPFKLQFSRKTEWLYHGWNLKQFPPSLQHFHSYLYKLLTVYKAKLQWCTGVLDPVVRMVLTTVECRIVHASGCPLCLSLFKSSSKWFHVNYWDAFLLKTIKILALASCSIPYSAISHYQNSPHLFWNGRLERYSAPLLSSICSILDQRIECNFTQHFSIYFYGHKPKTIITVMRLTADGRSDLN